MKKKITPEVDEARNNKILNMISKLNHENIDLPRESLLLHFTIPGKPIPYARERYTSFGRKGGRFYNKRAGEMNDINTLVRNLVDMDKLSFINNPDLYYEVRIDFDFYVPIPKSDSIKTAALKEMKHIRPITRPDKDNYEKFLLDSLHGILYDDDKRYVSSISNKYYSIHPRTDVRVEITGDFVIDQDSTTKRDGR